MPRKIFGLVVIFVVVYLGAHFYIRWKNTVNDDVTKIGRLVECQPNEVRSISLQQGIDGKIEAFRFERLDHPEPGMPAVSAVARWEWQMESPLKGAADSATMRRIASSLCELYDPVPVRAEEFHGETQARRLARRLDVSLESSGTIRNVTVEFGALVDRSTVIRFSSEGKERVVRVPDHFIQVVSLPPDDYRNMRVMRNEADNVQHVTLVVDGKERFSLERAGADWSVVSHGKSLGAGSDEAGKFLNRVSTLKALGVQEERFSSDACVALKAKVTLDFRDITDKQEIVKFDYGPIGDVTACSSRGSQKFRVHHDMVQFLDVPIKKVLAKK